MEKATIYDYARMCNKVKDCKKCPLSSLNNGLFSACNILIREHPDKANEIILKWCKEHPAVTRQSKIQKIIPAITLNADEEYVDICPNEIDTDFNRNKLCDNYAECSDCKREYWLAEVDENE